MRHPLTWLALAAVASVILLLAGMLITPSTSDDGRPADEVKSSVAEEPDVDRPAESREQAQRPTRERTSLRIQPEPETREEDAGAESDREPVRLAGAVTHEWQEDFRARLSAALAQEEFEALDVRAFSCDSESCRASLQLSDGGEPGTLRALVGRLNEPEPDAGERPDSVASLAEARADDNGLRVELQARDVDATASQLPESVQGNLEALEGQALDLDALQDSGEDLRSRMEARLEEDEQSEEDNGP